MNNIIEAPLLLAVPEHFLILITYNRTPKWNAVNILSYYLFEKNQAVRG